MYEENTSFACGMNVVGNVPTLGNIEAVIALQVRRTRRTNGARRIFFGQALLQPFE